MTIKNRDVENENSVTQSDVLIRGHGNEKSFTQSDALLRERGNKRQGKSTKQKIT